MVSISASTVVPIAYLILVLGSLVLFSAYYRRRKALQSKNLDPWFPAHPERDIYLTLLHLEDPPAPLSVLKAALLNRAQEDIRRIYILRQAKPAASSLLVKGSLGEATFKALIAAEQELNDEIQDVIAEARGLGGEEWGTTIFPQANEGYQRTVMFEAIKRGSKYASKQEELAKERNCGKKGTIEKNRSQELLQELFGDNSRDAGEGVPGDISHEKETERLSSGEPFVPNSKDYKKRYTCL